MGVEGAGEGGGWETLVWCVSPAGAPARVGHAGQGGGRGGQGSGNLSGHPAPPTPRSYRGSLILGDLTTHTNQHCKAATEVATHSKQFTHLCTAISLVREMLSPLDFVS